MLLFKNWRTCSTSEITALTFVSCFVHNGKMGNEKNTVNMIRMEKMNCVAGRYTENGRVMPRSQSENILLILCLVCPLNGAHVFLSDRPHFTTLCIKAILFPLCWRRACSVLFKACASDRITVRHWMSHHFYFRSQSNFP